MADNRSHRGRQLGTGLRRFGAALSWFALDVGELDQWVVGRMQSAKCKMQNAKWAAAGEFARRATFSVCLALLGAWLVCGVSSLVLAQERPLNVDAARAFGYLKRVCDIGPRVSGSAGMEKQQQLLIEHFSKFGCEIKSQTFDVAHPVNGTPVRMTNLVVSWQPTAKERVLICCHYDTRPYPDRDILRPRGTFIGANDGGSGVALLMEMAHHMRGIQPTYGVDFVFFDGEELVYRQGDKFFHGSEYFARWLRDKPPAYRYVCGVLVDMIGDKKLELYYERNSLDLAPKVTKSLWATAKRLGVKEFVDKVKHEVSDDHIALNQIAGVPTADIIDFDYTAWHTTRDVATACSGDSLSKVARVLLTWLSEVPAP